MEDILTLSSMVIKVLTWTAKTSFLLNPYFRFLTLELTSALPLTTRPPLAPRSPCTSPSPKVGKSFTADGWMRYMTICKISKDRDENLLPLSQFVSEPHVEPQRRPNWSQAVVSQAAHQFPRFSREPLPPYVHTIELAIWAFCHASVPAPLVSRWTRAFGPGSRYLCFIYALVNFFADIFGLFSSDLNFVISERDP